MKALAFSGGKDSMACLHLMRDELDCAIYVDTGFSFPETQALVRYAEKRLPVHIVKSDRRGQNEGCGIPADVVPMAWTVMGQALTSKKPCTIQSYFDCCFSNIAQPLFAKALELGVTELVYGQRDSEGHRGLARDGDVILGIVRRHPIEKWSDTEVLDFLAGHMEIPAHYAIKHSSLDCYDCTAFRKDSADRIEWMREQHPHFYEAYEHRAKAVRAALAEAIG